MEEDEETTPSVEIETIEIECKVEIDEGTDLEVERESDSDDGSNDGLRSDSDSEETTTNQGIKRSKGNKYGKKKKKKEEESDEDDDIEEVRSNDPLDVSDELNESDRLNDPTGSNHTRILDHFTRWQIVKQLSGYTEDVFLTYFKELEVCMNPTSLWNAYCSLKLALLARGTVDINRYHKLKYYIRKVTEGLREKESRVFTEDDIKRFLKDAPDDIYLAWKVALIIGVTGGCRCNELRDLTVDDVTLHGSTALVQIQESSKKQRSYAISGNNASYIKKYLEIRPKNLATKQLLVACKYNKFSKQGMGKEMIASIPTGVANFLDLPHADEYRGHTFRRTFIQLNPLKQSNTVNSDGESDNEIDNHDNNDIDNNQVDNHDNRTIIDSNRKMPAKIYKKFLEIHDQFKQWMKRMRVPYIFEDCVLTYFKELAKNYKPMSLWKIFTMLRYTLLSKDNLDIRSYKEVTDYLKEGVDEARERPPGAFAAKDVDVFVNQAPDDMYLGTKVALLVGVSGACNCEELLSITTDNVRRYGTAIIVKVTESKNKIIKPNDSNKKYKTFLIPDNYYDCMKRYLDLRIKDKMFSNFLIQYKNGKSTGTIMKKMMLRSIPKEVASYLNISNADHYTGYYFRRTGFVLFNLTTISLTNDSGNSDDDGHESDNHNDNDNQVDNSDNKVENTDKANIIDNKCSSGNINIIDKHDNSSGNNTDIDNKKSQNNAVDNKYNDLDLEDDLFEITPDIVEDQNDIDNNSKPGWHPRYDEIYNYFMRWLEKKSTKSFSENVMLEYFKELSEKFKPSTLWSQYYVLKRTLIIKNDVDISDYDELKDFLKRKADGFRSTKSRVFTLKQIDEFLEKAPDDEYLHWKVALILGIKGACKCTELLNLTTEHINVTDDLITVKVQETRNRKRKFYISDHYFPYVKKYIDLRPSDCKTNRFLLLIKNKKVIKVRLGKPTLNNIPKEIALYLNLPFPEEYNGHCFRTTSMSLFSHDALVRSNRQPGQLNAVGDFSKGRDEVDGGGNEGKVVTWPENDGKKALCWPLSVEEDDEVEELNEWTLNSESGVFEMIDRRVK